MTTTIKCAICGHEDVLLADHLAEVHGMSVDEYLSAHAGAPVVSEGLWDAFTKTQPKKRRRQPPTLDNLRLNFAGLDFPINHMVPESACLPLPPNYRVPEAGDLGKDISHAAIALRCKRSLYIWGMPGSGKDAFLHAYSALTRTPGIIQTVQPGTDIQSWFFSRSFDQNGTFWEEGDVLKALRDGFVAADGTRVPYMVLISDFDRADRSQAESLRLVLDSIKGRVAGPTGQTYDVMPGTIVCMTANTAGGGDERGRMISANPIDASLLDRIQVKLQFHWLDWKDEVQICRAKFPELVERCPGVFAQVGAATAKVRAAIHAEEIHCEWSHRAVCNWLQHAEDIVFAHGGVVPDTLLKRASRVVLDGLPDQEHRDGVRKLLDPHIPGGALNAGDTSHIGKGSLTNGF